MESGQINNVLEVSNNMNRNLVFIDVESDGLYGSFLTVALVATDIKGNEIERAYYGIKKENMKITEPWVQENVVPILGDYENCENETELLQKAWDFWSKYRENAYAVCDVGFPVEARFLAACVGLDSKENTFKAPFPLVDISSLLLAKGIDPLIERTKFLGISENELVHNAMFDVEMAILIWKRLMEERYE